jgi:methionyl-tRNA formyltransferase
MRLVFAGTPTAAVPSLEALLGSEHEVAAVITRPDAPAGRGRRLAPSAVAQRARSAGIEVLQPQRAADPQFLARLAQISPDCCPVTAYGALITAGGLAIPRHGWVNLHFSLLPAWRGAAPVQHAILHGDEITGATTFRLVPELDAGPVFGVVTEPVRPRDTAGELLQRLSRSGAALLAATVDGIAAGRLHAEPQPADGVSYAPKLRPEDAKVDWKLPALAIDRLIRACTPAPGAWTGLLGTRLRLGPLAAVGPAQSGAPLEPGELRIGRGSVQAGTGTVPVTLGDVQPDGRRPMAAADWARGLRRPGAELVLG